MDSLTQEERIPVKRIEKSLPDRWETGPKVARWAFIECCHLLHKIA